MKKLVIMLFVLMFYTLIHSNASIAGWVQIGDTTFFDTSNIEYTKNDTIYIWLKDKLTTADIYKLQIKANDFYKPYDKYLDRSFYGYTGDYNYHNYAEYSFSIQQFEYDCNNKLSRLIIEYDYDKYNGVINKTYDLESSFTNVVPNSANAHNLDEVCHFAKNKEDKSRLYLQRRSMPEVQDPKINKGSGLWSTKPDK